MAAAPAQAVPQLECLGVEVQLAQRLCTVLKQLPILTLGRGAVGCPELGQQGLGRVGVGAGGVPGPDPLEDGHGGVGLAPLDRALGQPPAQGGGIGTAGFSERCAGAELALQCGIQDAPGFVVALGAHEGFAEQHLGPSAGRTGERQALERLDRSGGVAGGEGLFTGEQAGMGCEGTRRDRAEVLAGRLRVPRLQPAPGQGEVFSRRLECRASGTLRVLQGRAAVAHQQAVAGDWGQGSSGEGQEDHREHATPGSRGSNSRPLDTTASVRRGLLQNQKLPPSQA